MKKARCDVYYWTVKGRGNILSKTNQQGLRCVFDRTNSITVRSFGGGVRMLRSEIEIDLQHFGIKWKGTVGELAQCLRKEVVATELFPQLQCVEDEKWFSEENRHVREAHRKKEIQEALSNENDIEPAASTRRAQEAMARILEINRLQNTQQTLNPLWH